MKWTVLTLLVVLAWGALPCRSALARPAAGCRTAADCRAQGVTFEAAGEYGLAYERFARACRLKLAEGCAKAARIEAGGEAFWFEPRRLLDLHRRGCQLGDEPSCTARDRLARVLEKTPGSDHPPAALKDEADRFLLRNQFVEAYALFQALCAAGHGPGCDALSRMMARGKGAPPDLVQAMAYGDKACKLGHKEACQRLSRLRKELACDDAVYCSNLADAFFEGRGARWKSPVFGVYLKRRACELGQAKSCLQVGGYYRAGVSDRDQVVVPKDRREALAAWRRACELGSGQACWQVADQQAASAPPGRKLGRGALALYRRACEKEHAPACALLAKLYGEGTRVKRDPAAARGFRAAACNMGQGEACLEVARGYERGEPRPADPVKARVYYTAACRLLKRAEACARAGDLCAGGPECLKQGQRLSRGQGVERNQVLAYFHFRTGCELGHMTSCAAQAKHLSLGQGVEKDLPEANRLAKQACDQDDADGCHLLAGFHEKGKGRPADGAKALKLYRKSCALGNKLACGLARLADVGRDLKKLREELRARAAARARLAAAGTGQGAEQDGLPADPAQRKRALELLAEARKWQAKVKDLEEEMHKYEPAYVIFGTRKRVSELGGTVIRYRTVYRSANRLHTAVESYNVYERGVRYSPGNSLKYDMFKRRWEAAKIKLRQAMEELARLQSG